MGVPNTTYFVVFLGQEGITLKT